MGLRLRPRPRGQARRRRLRPSPRVAGCRRPHRACPGRSRHPDAQDPSAAPAVRGERVPGWRRGTRPDLRNRGEIRAPRDDPHRDLRLSGSAEQVRGSDGRRRRGHRFSEAAHHPRARGTAALHADSRLPRKAASQRPPRPVGHSAEEAARVPSAAGRDRGQVPVGHGLAEPGILSMRKNADEFLALPISEDAKRKILWENGAKLIA